MHQGISKRGVLLHVLVRWVKRGTGLVVLVLLTAHLFVERGSSTSMLANDTSADRRQLTEVVQNSSNSSQHSGHELKGSHRCDDHAVSHSLESTLSYVIMCFFTCSLLDHCNLLVPFKYRFPISVVLFIFGKLFGYVCHKFSETGKFNNMFDGVDGASHMNPHAVFYILLPPLLYESASSLDWYVFKKVVTSSVILALPGVLLNIGLTAIFLYLVVDFGQKNLNLEASFTLATILSATDPVAVVSALHELGAPKKLAHLIEGESLLNDGSAVVFFFVFLDMLATRRPESKKQCSMDEEFPSYHLCVVAYFMRLAAGGVLFGFLVGCVLHFWIKRASNRQSAPLEFTIVLGAIYGTFFIAEVLHVSGVLAVVTLGTMMTASIHPRLSQDGRHSHHIVLEEIGYVCNMCIFFTAGIISTRFMFIEKGSCDGEPLFQSPRKWGELIGVYVWIHITRSLVTLSFQPALARLGYGLKWKEACILVYGGLRGAVGLAMGLLVEHDEYVDRDISAVIAFHTSGIVLMTLCINGSTIDELYRNLEPYPPNPFRMNHIRKVLCTVEEECRKVGLRELHRHWFFCNAEFKRILGCVPHFGHIHFENGIAHPCGIHKVSHTLRMLTAHATMELVQEKPADPTASGSTNGVDMKRSQSSSIERQASSTADFEKRWEVRKKDLRQKCKMWLLHSAVDRGTTNGAGRQKRKNKTIYNDQLIAVDYYGNNELEYDASGQIGFYVSVLDLCAVSNNQDQFSVKLLRVEATSVVIGFFIDPDGIRTVSERDGPQLGNTTGTVAFDCSSGVLTKFGLGQYGMQQESSHFGPVSAGMTVTVSVRPSATQIGCHTASFEVSSDDKEGGSDRELLGIMDIDDNLVQDIFPVVEFRPSLLKATKSGPLRSSSDMKQRSGSSISTKDSKVSADTFWNNMQKSSQVVGLRSGTNVISANISGNISMKHFASKKDQAQGAGVRLSFEPQIATDNQSLSETFQVFFNAVTHRYEVMHDQGILSTPALSTVCEAVSKATDCMNREMNAVNVSKFRGLQRLGKSSIHLGESIVCPQSSTRSSHKKVSRHITEALQEMREENGGVAILEPLVVEYLSLEQMCSRKSFFENFPHSWTWLRQFGYTFTRTKIESLWAFVESHESVLRDFPSLRQRCPELVACLKDVIREAKNDLKILEELRPRRFYYCKHFLALRFIMCRRLERLKRFITEGWISHGDGEGLIHALQSRIAQVEQYVPHSSLYMTAEMVEQRRSDGFVFGEQGDESHAWAEEDVSREGIKKAGPSMSQPSEGDASASTHVFRRANNSLFRSLVRSVTAFSVGTQKSVHDVRKTLAKQMSMLVKQEADEPLHPEPKGSQLVGVVEEDESSRQSGRRSFSLIEVVDILPMQQEEAADGHSSSHDRDSDVADKSVGSMPPNGSLPGQCERHSIAEEAYQLTLTDPVRGETLFLDDFDQDDMSVTQSR